jgi:hypothetical protein
MGCGGCFPFKVEQGRWCGAEEIASDIGTPLQLLVGNTTVSLNAG